MTTPEENKAIVQRYYEDAFNVGDMDILNEVIAADVINHDPLSDETLTSEEARGLEGFRHHVEAARAGFPDATVTIRDMIAEDDKVLVRFDFTGTHEGRIGGIEPTHEKVTVSNMAVYRIEDGKLAERWLESNDLDMLQQLGVTPRMEKARPGGVVR